jgi:hypothetical protein
MLDTSPSRCAERSQAKSTFRTTCSLVALAVRLVFPLSNDLPFVRAQVSPAAGSIYSVSSDGSDTAAGTQEALFRAIQRAASLIDAVVVRAGKYAGLQLG